MTVGAPILPPKMRASTIEAGRQLDFRGIVFTLEERVAGTPPVEEGEVLLGSFSGTPTLVPFLLGNFSSGSATPTDVEEASFSDP